MQISPIEFPGGVPAHVEVVGPDRPPRGDIVLLHGLAEHSGRYVDLANHLVAAGWRVAVFDHRGHGLSGGSRVWITRFDDYVADARHVLSELQNRIGFSNPVVFGQSMGGAVAARLAQLDPESVRALIVSAAAFEIATDVAPWLQKLAWLGSALIPRVRLVNIGFQRLSSRREVVDDFRRDPLVFHGKMPGRTGYEILRIGGQILRSAAAIRMPTLVLHGMNDTLCLSSGSEAFHEAIGSNDKRIVLYEDQWHDLIHEPRREDVFADITTWLDERTLPAPSADEDATRETSQEP